MIGKSEWFKYRIFGWGVAPKTWQGWVYLAAAAALLAFATAITYNNALKPWIFGIIVALFLADVLHIMSQLHKTSDERENMHQLIIERNCSFAAIVALLGVAIYQSYSHRVVLQLYGTFPFDISILIVLGAMFITKIASTIYVHWRM